MESAIKTELKMSLTTLATRRNLVNTTFVTDLAQSSNLVVQTFILPKNTIVSSNFTNSLSVSQLFSSKKIIHIFSDIPFDITFDQNAGIAATYDFRVESYFNATMEAIFKIRNPSTLLDLNASIICG